ncbi:MAG: ring-1,2-phenylacetyl-CoA epoxidase subunit PaaE [Sphingobacteriales bacterium]|jgi:ring-1,2-phenylacetyl-CoA epoxidase subunit PaaE
MAINFYPLKLKQKDRLTADSTAFHFEVPSKHQDVFQFIPGQYLTLKTVIDGLEERRSYSICQPKLTDTISVAVKRLDGGKMSNWLIDHLSLGMKLEIMPPQGLFTSSTSKSTTKGLFLIAAGSGITPIMAILEDALLNSDVHIHLLYGNRDEKSIMFSNRLAELTLDFPDRFHAQHYLTQPEVEGFEALGRIDDTKLEQYLGDNNLESKNLEYYLCGPQTMVEIVFNHIRAKGVKEESIHRELFYVEEKEQETPQNSDQKPVNITVILEDEEMPLVVEPYQTILQAMLEAGMDAPFSCQGGICATCMGKVLSGSVTMKENMALTDGQVEDGYVLGCQSIPTEGTIIEF